MDACSSQRSSPLPELIAGRQRSRGQLLQLAVMLPIVALLGQWLMLQLQPLTGWQIWGATNPNLDELATESLLTGILLMLALLLIPVLESSFGLLTRARLLELADRERPCCGACPAKRRAPSSAH